MALSRMQRQWAVGGGIGLGAFILGTVVARRRPAEMFSRRDREPHGDHEGRHDHHRGEYGRKEHGHHHKEHDRGER